MVCLGGRVHCRAVKYSYGAPGGATVAVQTSHGRGTPRLPVQICQVTDRKVTRWDVSNSATPCVGEVFIAVDRASRPARFRRERLCGTQSLAGRSTCPWKSTEECRAIGYGVEGLPSYGGSRCACSAYHSRVAEAKGLGNQLCGGVRSRASRYSEQLSLRRGLGPCEGLDRWLFSPSVLYQPFH